MAYKIQLVYEDNGPESKDQWSTNLDARIAQMIGLDTDRIEDSYFFGGNNRIITFSFRKETDARQAVKMLKGKRSTHGTWIGRIDGRRFRVSLPTPVQSARLVEVLKELSWNPVLSGRIGPGPGRFRVVR